VRTIADKILGSMRDQELLQLQKQCHELFDPIWVDGILTRQDAYKLLAAAMDVSLRKAHIRYFSKQQCEELIGCLTGIKTQV
jgi:hypothetical protein